MSRTAFGSDRRRQLRWRLTGFDLDNEEIVTIEILGSNAKHASSSSGYSRDSTRPEAATEWQVTEPNAVGLDSGPLDKLLGNCGGQRIFTLKPLIMVVVITAGNYNMSNVPLSGIRILEESIFPAAGLDGMKMRTVDQRPLRVADSTGRSLGERICPLAIPATRWTFNCFGPCFVNHGLKLCSKYPTVERLAIKWILKFA